MTLNEQSALYQQIAKMLEDGILRGIYREEEQVSSTNELARSLHINPATAAKGINELVEQGILYKRRGIGKFVAQGAGQAVRASRQAAFYKRFVCPMVKEAAGLGPTVQLLSEMVARAAEEGKQ